MTMKEKCPRPKPGACSTLLVIRATILLCLIALVARQLTPMAVPRTAHRPPASDEQALEVVDQKGGWFEAIVVGWLLIIVMLHTALSHTIHTKA
jgi:hypothetical protein